MILILISSKLNPTPFGWAMIALALAWAITIHLLIS
jgi:hypothetical protein